MPELTLPIFVKQIAVKLTEEDVAMPLRNQQLWHALFYRLKNEKLPGKPAFLENLWFDWDGPAPESPELTEVLARLHWNAAVSATNPSFETIKVRPEVATLWKQQTPPLTVDQTAFLTAAANQAKQAFTAGNENQQ